MGGAAICVGLNRGGAWHRVISLEAYARKLLSLFRFVVPFIIVFASTTIVVHARELTKRITQYTQDVWGTDAGLPNSTITTMAQAVDGYLWLGTEEGLARFDGVRFKVFDKQNTPDLESDHISALYPGSQGNLWIGTQGGGLTELRGEHFTTYTTRNGLANDVVLSLYEDSKGTLWIGTNGGGLQRLRGGQFTTYTSKNGLPNDAVFSLAGGVDGSLWIGTHAGLGRLQHEHFTTYTMKDGLKDDYIKCLHAPRTGELWIGTNQGGISRYASGSFTNYTRRDGLLNDTVWSIYEDQTGAVWVGTNEGGLSRFRNGNFENYSVKDGLPVPTVMSFLEDREKNFWLGTLGGGLVRLKDGPFTVFTSREGLSNDVVLPVLEDHEGNIWVGTHGGGVNRLSADKVTTLSTENGLSDNVVLSITEDHEGSIWMANRKCVDRWKRGKFVHYCAGSGLPNSIVLSLYTGRDGTVWAGSRAGLSRFDGHRFTTYTTKDGLSNNYVASIYQDQRNVMWIGTGGGGLNRFESGRFSEFNTSHGLSSNFIWSITGDADGTLWIGTSGGGLNRLKNGRFKAFTVHDGLLDDEVFEVLADDYGFFWMSCNKGVFRIKRSQLDAFAEGTLPSITSVAYSTSDGFKNKECNGGFQPAGWRTRDGHLLFPTMKGLARVDPARLGVNGLPPPVVIEDVFIDGKKVNPEVPIKGKPGNGRLQINFTALTLVSSDKVRFKYKLDGFDKDWSEEGTSRSANYTNIPPGEYRFSIIACNNSGVWNRTGASISLTISPHFYQTHTFQAFCIGLVGLLCFGVYRLRIQHLRVNEKKLVLLVDQRTQALQEEVKAKERAHEELADAQQHLMALSRMSGMAEVASGVLHNVGNVLNSVNVGASVIGARVRELRVDNLVAAVDMLESHAGDLSEFVATDPKGKRVLPYLEKLASHLHTERQQIVSEVEGLTRNIDHIKQIVAREQNYAKVSDIVEPVSIPELLEDALNMVEASLGRHSIQIVRDLEDVPEIPVSRHKVLQILVNLLRNATQAVSESNGRRQVRISVRRHGDDKVRVGIQDTGVGIAPENLTRIFAHGFTTRPDGHGFGLHSGAIAARQMHGSLWAESEGIGRGATFILELPMNAVCA